VPGRRFARAGGIALVVILLVLGLLSTLGLALLIALASEPGSNANQRDAAIALHAADGALEVAIHELALANDWTPQLSGLTSSRWTDGPPSGARMLPGGQQVDLTALTNQLTCGRTTACTDADRAVSSEARPWGTNNPWWRPFVHGSPEALGLTSFQVDYLVVWIGDDALERDGDPSVDGGTGQPGEGRAVLRLRATAIGPGAARRSVEAVLARLCFGADGGPPCAPGSRVQSWRDLRNVTP
jgi:hypothetical protein